MSTPKITKIKKANLTDQIYITLKKFILSGEWPVGFQVPSESELANQFGVSRMTARNALQKLSALNLIDVRIGEGTFVKEFSLSNYVAEVGSILIHSKSMAEIAQFRKAFELEALKSMNEKYTSDMLAVLESYLKKMLEAISQNDTEEFIEWDFKFHRYICTMSGNSIFEALYDICGTLLKDYYRYNVSVSPIGPNSKTEQEDHVVLFHYIKEHNMEKALEVYRNLIDYPLCGENYLP